MEDIWEFLNPQVNCNEDEKNHHDIDDHAFDHDALNGRNRTSGISKIL